MAAIPGTNKYIAECVGTFALVFTGTCAVVTNDVTNGIVGLVGIALTFGLIVAAMIYSIGNVSGAHMNPAVTLGFWFAGRFPRSDVLPYITAQVIGAFIASGLLRFLFPEHPHLGATLPHPSISVSQTFIFEVILTFILMFVILNVSTGAMEKGIMAGVAVGGTVALAALFAGPICGASMNPARSLGPAVVSGQTQHLWVYLTAPVLGAFLASPMCRIIQGEQCCTEEGSEGSCGESDPNQESKPA